MKTVNDTYGHLVGDQYLKHFAAALRAATTDVCGANAVANEDPVLLARIGGDEFVLLLRGNQGETDAARVVSNLQARLASPQTIAGLSLHMRFSAGSASAPMQAADRIQSLADRALYAAKTAGRNRAAIAAPEGSA
jgi:diguanylate cyclase (GGDEF)-like protein